MHTFVVVPMPRSFLLLCSNATNLPFLLLSADEGEGMQRCDGCFEKLYYGEGRSEGDQGRV